VPQHLSNNWLDCFATARNDEKMSTAIENNLTTLKEPHTRISITRIAREELPPLPQGTRVNKTVKHLTTYRPNDF